MALNGTLSDLGVVDLIQFPSAGRKTGELIITGPDDEARLYYSKGNLVHLVLGSHKGMDALVEIVSWEEGEFEFRLGVHSDERSLKTDLHRALMQALKTRDERAEANRQRAAGKQPAQNNGRLQGKLKAFVDATAYVQAVYVLSQAGELLAEVSSSKRPSAKIKSLPQALSQLIESVDRPNFKRVLVEDELGTIVAVHLKNGEISILHTGKDTSLGAASMSANRLAAVLEGR